MPRCDLRALAAVLLLATTTATADPASDAAYEEGRRLYDLREWDQAIAKFKESYRLAPEPKSLFNIAQAYRLKGDCVEAINFYRTYKRNFPKEKNIGKVDKFITELEPCAKQGKPAPVSDPRTEAKPEPRVEPAKKPPVPTTQLEPKREPKPLQLESNPQPRPDVAQVAPAVEPAPPIVRDTPSDPGKGKRTAGIAIAGVGSVAFAVGVYFGLKARSLASDVENGSGEWTPEIEEDAFSADNNAKLFMAIGGVGLVTGGIFYYLGKQSPEPRAGVSIVPRSGGALVVWSGNL